MARIINRLTNRKIASLNHKGRYADGNGLSLQVTDQQTKSWLFRYTLREKQRQMGLAPLDTVSLAKARGKLLDCRKSLLEDNDPIEKRERGRQPAIAPRQVSNSTTIC